MFTWPVRVYWEDTDGGGVVYHSQYVNFFERARTEWLRSIGLDQSRLQSELNLVFAIHRIEVGFIRPARLDDQLIVSVKPEWKSAARMQFKQTITKATHSDQDDTQNELIATADVYAVSLSAREFKPVRIPDTISEIFKNTIKS